MEDVGCVWVQVVACEGLCSVLRCVAGVVEGIIGVLVLARSALFVHAVTDGGPCGSGRGQVGVVVKGHLGAWSGFHATVGLVLVRWNHGATHA